MPEHKKSRKKELFKIFSKVPVEVIVSEGAVWDVSRFDMARFMTEKDAELYERMLKRLRELDKKRKEEIS